LGSHFSNLGFLFPITLSISISFLLIFCIQVFFLSFASMPCKGHAKYTKKPFLESCKITSMFNSYFSYDFSIFVVKNILLK